MEKVDNKVNYIKAKIKEVITQSNLTQKEIADYLSVSQSCVAHYIKGDIIPSLDTFAKLCQLLDVDPNYILGIKGKE